MACILLWREEKDTDIHSKGRPCEGVENMTSYKTEREGPTLVTPWPEASKLQNCWKINTQSVVLSFANPSKPVEGSDDCREDGRKEEEMRIFVNRSVKMKFADSISVCLAVQTDPWEVPLFNREQTAQDFDLGTMSNMEMGGGVRVLPRFLAVFSPDTHLLQWFINTWPPDYSSNFVLWCFLHVSCEITVQ